ncbi:MAG: hypothetical protein AB1792_02310 [Candidatus Zixiibacteriota bacterium]
MSVSDRQGSVRCMMIGFPPALILIANSMLIAGCGTAEKYQKPPEKGALVSGTAEMRLEPQSAAWARDLTSALDAGRLALEMGDTARGFAVTDSILGVAEEILDTLPDGTQLQKFLVLVAADAYGRLVSWEKARGNEAGSAGWTARFGALATKLKARHDSAQALPAESSVTGD